MKSEYSIWRDELHPPAKPTLSERIKAAWPMKPIPAEPCIYAWHSVEELIPIEGDADV